MISSSFYGYQTKEETYLKIFFYSHFALDKAKDLLQVISMSINHS